MSACVGGINGICGTFQSFFQPGLAAAASQSDEAWQLCAQNVEGELASPAPNLLRVERLIRKACEEKSADPEALFARVYYDGPAGCNGASYSFGVRPYGIIG